jgi:hypothetical protein
MAAQKHSVNNYFDVETVACQQWLPLVAMICRCMNSRSLNMNPDDWALAPGIDILGTKIGAEIERQLTSPPIDPAGTKTPDMQASIHIGFFVSESLSTRIKVTEGPNYRPKVDAQNLKDLLLSASRLSRHIFC